jgi:hypothetical protein
MSESHDSESHDTTEIILEPKETTELLETSFDKDQDLTFGVKENETTEIISEPKELDTTNESTEITKTTETVQNIVDILKNILLNTQDKKNLSKDTKDLSKDTKDLSKENEDKELSSGEQTKENTNNLTKENITLTSLEINVLTSILNLNPTLIVEVQESINKNLKDNNINISDIPELLSIVKKIVDAINSLKNINKSNIPQTSSNILKFLIRVLIKENIIIVSNSEEFLTNFDKLVDSVTELITFLNVNKNPICNINWCKLFSCTK